MKVLVVTSEFAGHERGSTITDPQEIEAVLAGENAHRVTVAEHGQEPAEAAPAKKSK